MRIYTNPAFRRHQPGAGHPESVDRIDSAIAGVVRAGEEQSLVSDAALHADTSRIIARVHSADYDRALPTPTPPPYDGGAAMRDVADFVATQGDRFLFVYGQWDPWTGGQYALGQATDSLLVIEPEGTHGARINGLAAADRDAAYDKIEAWTGIRPTAPDGNLAPPRREVREPRIPPAMIRALRARR